MRGGSLSWRRSPGRSRLRRRYATEVLATSRVGQQIASLIRRHSETFGGFVNDLAARGCQALAYRLNGEAPIDHLCVKHLRGSLRVVVPVLQPSKARVPHPPQRGIADSVSGPFAVRIIEGTGDCMATGTSFSASGPTLAEWWNGKHWRIQPTPNPANYRLSFGEVALDGVSCTSAKACTASGEYSLSGAAAYFLEAWNGSSWRLVTARSGRPRRSARRARRRSPRRSA
jgi:hypothetical protein